MVEFKPTQKGLHVLNLKHNPDAAFILINDADLAYGKSRVPIVRQNYEGVWGFNKQLTLAAS